MKKLLIFIGVMFTLASCTDQEMAKNYGGEMEIKIPEGRKLVNMTWKESDLWILTEDSSYYYFSEQSNWGIWEGEIKVKK